MDLYLLPYFDLTRLNMADNQLVHVVAAGRNGRYGLTPPSGGSIISIAPHVALGAISAATAGAICAYTRGSSPWTPHWRDVAGLVRESAFFLKVE